MKARDKVENYGNQETFDEIKALKKKIDGVCRVHRFTQLDAFFVRWRKFFTNEDYCLEKSARILDFGCASGFSIFTGRKCGFNNIYGLDVKTKFYDLMIKHVIELIGIKDNIIFYKGYGKLPFEDDCFDIIVAVDAIGKDSTCTDEGGLMQSKGRLNRRIKELVKISKKHAKWYLRPHGDVKMIKYKFEELGLSKNIELRYLREMA